MKEEIRKQNAELSEEALENVSGGDEREEFMKEHDPVKETNEAKAKMICNSCHCPDQVCNPPTDLFDYLMAHGFSSVRIPKQCPYYTKK